MLTLLLQHEEVDEFSGEFEIAVLAMVSRMLFSLLNFTTSTTNLDTMRFAFRIHYGFV